MRHARVVSKIPQEQNRAIASAHSSGFRRPVRRRCLTDGRCSGYADPARRIRCLQQRVEARVRGEGDTDSVAPGVASVPGRVSPTRPAAQPPLRMRRARVVLKIPQEQNRAIASAHSSGFRRPVRTKSSICRAKPKESIP